MISARPSRHAPRALLAVVVVVATVGVISAGAPPASGTEQRLVPLEFFGQHLGNPPNVIYHPRPDFPKQAIRLWDSATFWCQLNPAPGRFTFVPGNPSYSAQNQLDQYLAYAASVGADVVYTFGRTPRWAATGVSAGGLPCTAGVETLAPKTDQAWTDFVTALVQHQEPTSGKGIAYFELWNEADSAYFWNGSMARMVTMSTLAAPIIHGAGRTVLSPSITRQASGLPWLADYRDAVGPGVVDVVAIHTYTNGDEPDDFLPGYVDSVRQTMNPNPTQVDPFEDADLWATEGSWGSADHAPAAADQPAFVARYNLQLLSSGVGRSYWYRYGGQIGTLWDGTQLTPAGVAMQALGKWLAGATLTIPCGQDDGVWTCTITRNGGYVGRIVWVTTGSHERYKTNGFSTLRTLGDPDDNGSPVSAEITVIPEPQLLQT